ncbi:ExbD/TolR family protein [Amantichitinum ursilacus]|uniref:Biopolymer transport protein ExbD n=1 Tax=Amantichitinum ursilacus TaxID=857265 RepID=A0A0N0XFV5_9NEIS|nr:biopolymer transporter ExbD [Amantichitinum ursilacus]KPC49389.1 Biopolymer transport protein ExbD [Amantichitinum ursilacus]
MAFSKSIGDSGEVMSEINMTPLVDVMLVLLIIFMLTVPVLTHAVKVDLPRAANQPEIVKPQTVNISVVTDGSIYWDEARLTDAEFKTRLAEIARKDPQPNIRLRGDRKVPYEFVAKAMAAIQSAGVQKLGFVTEPDPQ